MHIDPAVLEGLAFGAGDGRQGLVQDIGQLGPVLAYGEGEVEAVGRGGGHLEAREAAHLDAVGDGAEIVEHGVGPALQHGLQAIADAPQARHADIGEIMLQVGLADVPLDDRHPLAGHVLQAAHEGGVVPRDQDQGHGQVGVRELQGLPALGGGRQARDDIHVAVAEALQDLGPGQSGHRGHGHAQALGEPADVFGEHALVLAVLAQALERQPGRIHAKADGWVLRQPGALLLGQVQAAAHARLRPGQVSGLDGLDLVLAHRGQGLGEHGMEDLAVAAHGHAQGQGLVLVVAGQLQVREHVAVDEIGAHGMGAHVGVGLARGNGLEGGQRGDDGKQPDLGVIGGQILLGIVAALHGHGLAGQIGQGSDVFGVLADPDGVQGGHEGFGEEHEGVPLRGLDKARGHVQVPGPEALHELAPGRGHELGPQTGPLGRQAEDVGGDAAIFVPVVPVFEGRPVGRGRHPDDGIGVHPGALLAGQAHGFLLRRGRAREPFGAQGPATRPP